MEVVRSYRTEGTVDGTTGADGVVGPDVPGADGAVVPDGDPEGIDEPGAGSDGLLSEGADRQSVAGHGYGRRSGLHGDSERLRMDRRWLPPWPRCCFFVTRGIPVLAWRGRGSRHHFHGLGVDAPPHPVTCEYVTDQTRLRTLAGVCLSLVVAGC